MVLQVIYIVRHGFRPNWHVDREKEAYLSRGYTSPTGIATDPPLASYGVDQAEKLCLHLQGVSPPIDVVYSSPYSRCIQTIQPFATSAQKPVRIEHGISEYFEVENFKYPLPADLAKLQQKFPRNFFDDQYTSLAYPLSEFGETPLQLHDRVALALHCIIDQVDHDTIVDHSQTPAVTRPVKAILICSHAAPIIAAGRVLTGETPQTVSTKDFDCFTCGLSMFVRRTSQAVRSRLVSNSLAAPKFPDWKHGKGISGGWDCVLNSYCDFLPNGPERGWSFVDDISFTGSML